jgi:hypothetical protein
VKLLCVLAIAALATGASTAIAQDAPAKPAEEKKICRAVTPTGSVMSKRICLTKAEWKKLNAAYEQQNSTFRDGQSRSGVNPTQ